MKENSVHLGDCLVWMKEQPDEFVDLTVTSPPYDNLRTYGKKGDKENAFPFDFHGIAKELYRITKKGGVVVWVVADETVNGGESGTSFRQALYFMECGFKLHDTMIYEKNTSSFPSGEKSNRYTQIFEYMFVFSKGKPSTANLHKQKPNKWGGWSTWGQAKKRTVDGGFIDIGVGKQAIKETGVATNIWRYVCSGGFGQSDKLAYEHPATFPEKLAEDHILTWSNPGDLVFDPFSGSGTTLLMAMKNNRRWIGTEVSQDYYDLIDKRFALHYEKGFKVKEEEMDVCKHCEGKGVVSVVQPKKLLKKHKKEEVAPATPTVALPEPLPIFQGSEDFTAGIQTGNLPIREEDIINGQQQA